MNQHLTSKLTFIISSTRVSFSFLNPLSVGKYSKKDLSSQIKKKKLTKKNAGRFITSQRHFFPHSYWFLRLYCSIKANSSLNGSTLSGFIFPAFSAFRFAFSQFSISCSSILCFEGFRLFLRINSLTSSYLVIQRSSCVIHHH